MRSVVAAVVLFTLIAAPALAQSARATGTVRDTSGRPIKGAAIRALNPDSYPSEFTAISDDKGRWAMIGLRTGMWTFRVQADGFDPVEATTQARVAATPPLAFILARALSPIPNALVPNIQEQLDSARVLRESGRLDQALSAYQEIRTKNPKLTSVNLVVADIYRKQAAQERDAAARRALFDRAIASYTEVLKTDSTHERANAELASTRAEAQR